MDDFNSENNIFYGAAAGKVGEWHSEALDDRTSTSKTAEAFERFVKNVAGIEIGSDKQVGLTLEGAAGSFFVSDFGDDSGVELHFAINEPVGMVCADLVDDGVDSVEVGIFTAGAVSGVREHGDFGLFVVVGYECGSRIFDDGVELVGIGKFIDATVSENEMFASRFFTHEAAGEILGSKREMIFAGEKNVAGRIIDTREERISGAGIQNFNGVGKVGGFDKLEVWK